MTAALLCGNTPIRAHEGHDHGAPDQAVAARKNLDAPTAAQRTEAPRTGGARWGANHFPNVPLLTHDGRSVRFFDDLIKDRVVLISFLYTNCADACPLATAQLAKLQQILGDRVGRDVYMYSISIDPARDTPQTLGEYAQRFHAGPGWVFLTGSDGDIRLLRQRLGVDASLPRDDLKDHNMSLLLGNQRTGQWIKRSPMDNPYFIAEQIGTWLTNWETPGAHSGNNYASAPELRPPSMGENLFRTRCAACHTLGTESLRTLDGGEIPAATRRALGPDLLDVTRRRERDWIARWLANPAKMLADKDPIATALYAEYGNLLMPNLRLNETEVGALIEYMDTESRRLAVATTGPRP